MVFSCNLIQAREFANELRASTKAPKNPAVWLEGSNNAGQNGSSADTSTVSDAYSKMLTIFIPLLVDEVYLFSLNAALIMLVWLYRQTNEYYICRVPFLHILCASKYLHLFQLVLLTLTSVDLEQMTLMMTT